MGRYAEAAEYLDSHIFHPWEGGEGKVPAQYQISRVEMAKKLLAEGEAQKAEKILLECLEYPHHLGEGKLHGAQENDFYFLLGMAADMKGDREKAVDYWRKGTVGPEEPADSLYYNDAKPDKIFYAGLCWRALGEENNALRLFNRLVSYGKQHLHDTVKMDYFAVSLPDLLIWDEDMDIRNEIHCRYMIALGSFGLGNVKRCESELEKVLALDPCHQGALALKSFMKL